MKNLVHSIIIPGILALGYVLIFSQYAYAYLDLGTGSYILQILIATIVGGLFVIKPFFRKIKNFFKRLFRREIKDESTEE